ncbi:MAG TPA: BON domain-containing protein [Longimicrobiales bacterium]|nr:BON domain-containing protein [Longimicrobiales bacterium]
MKTAKDLQRDVLDELEWEPSLHSEDIGVTATEDGVVTLTGFVKSYAEKERAERVAKRITGVHAVANDLRVTLPSAHTRTDTELAQAVLNALKWNVSVPEQRIKVTVKDGWVELDGEVNWQFQRQSAAGTVLPLVGVRGLTNRISVLPSPSPSAVHAKIEAALKRNAELDADQIMVESNAGKVVLKGTVRSWMEREEAEAAAWAAAGVTEVDNHIRIEYRAPSELLM